jgi:hypothetical protein
MFTAAPIGVAGARKGSPALITVQCVVPGRVIAPSGGRQLGALSDTVGLRAWGIDLTLCPSAESLSGRACEKWLRAIFKVAQTKQPPAAGQENAK